jgi:integrase
MARKETRSPLGSIFQRQIEKQGKRITVYDVRKRHKTADGTYKDKTKRCYTYAEALVVLGNMGTTVAELPPPDHKLFELTAYFRREYVKPAVFSRGKKIAGYKQSLKTVNNYLDEIEQFFGDVPLKRITYEHLRSFAERLASTPTKYGSLPAASTYHKKLTILGRLFNVAIQLDWIDVSPMRRGPSLIKRSSERQRNRMLTYEEEERLLEQCTGERAHLRPYIICALDTAMRRGEIYNLKWWQVDFEKGVIYLTGTAAADTKTGVEGVLPLTDRLAAEFSKLRDYRSLIMPNDLVLGRTEFKRSWKTACKLAGVADLQFRDLRASGATRMMLAGNVGDLVRKITRHQRLDTFIDHYTAIDEQNARTIGRKLDKFNKKEAGRVKARGEANKKTSAD